MDKEKNEGLVKRVKIKKGKVAVFSMGAYKTSGLDGFPLAFF